MERSGNTRTPSGTGSVWKENNVISMLEQNSVWRSVLPMGERLLLDRGRRWTESPGNDRFAFLDFDFVNLSV